MPELPEVETVCRGLLRPLKNKPLRAVFLRRKDLRFPIPTALTTMKAPVIKKISRRAKYILMQLEGDYTVIVHLGMSGSFVIYDQAPQNYDKHDHVIFKRMDGAEIAFRDPRRFGFILLAKTKELKNHKALKELGAEPLEVAFTGEALWQQIRTMNRPIKTALLDQTVIAGVGNIYASEALFLAGIKPTIKAKHLSLDRCDALVAAIKKVLTQAIAVGGSSLKDHRGVDGELGTFQHHFQVYDREQEPCPVCKTAIVKKTVSGRSTFFCPQCQKK